MVKISQVLKLLLLIAALLIITLLLFTPLRTNYLYFIVNLLIVSLGAEAGLISFFCKSPNDKKLSSTNIIITQKQHNMTTPVIYFPPSGTSEHRETAPKAKYDHLASTESSLLITTKNNTGYKVVEKCASEKIVGVAEVHEQVALVKKCPSMPSLFFIGDTGEETNEGHEILKEEKYDDQNDEEAVVLSKQELFYKAETFIGNFYKQLKMQREDSWKSLHDFYHKAAF